jgi:hypothetical protein
MTIFENVQIFGALTAQSMAYPPASIADASIAALANINYTKTQHQYVDVYSQVSTANAAVDRHVVYVARGTGSITDVSVGAVTAATSTATATIDVLKNGTSILSAPISLTSATAAFILLAGTLAVNPTPIAPGDVIEISVTAVNAGAGALAKGLFARVTGNETYV